MMRDLFLREGKMREPRRVRTKVFSLLMAGLVFLSDGSLWAQKRAQKTLEVIGPQAIFKLPSREIDLKVTEKMQACRSTNSLGRVGDHEFLACVVSVMKDAGASPQA